MLKFLVFGKFGAESEICKNEKIFRLALELSIIMWRHTLNLFICLLQDISTGGKSFVNPGTHRCMIDQ